MLKVPPDLLGRDVDLGRVEITNDQIRRYAVAIGDRDLAAGPCDVAPLGFALAIRGGPVPAVDLAPDTISVHAGHAITAGQQPLIVPATYSVRARLTDVFEKNGRSGALTVIARRAELRSLDGALVATVDDQQIVRWRRASTAPLAPSPEEREETEPHTPSTQHRGPTDATDTVEPGTLLGRLHRPAPSAAEIASYAGWLGGPERLFTDRAFAGSLGYADVIVPGPLQSALIESMLRRWLPGWQLQRLGLTFRVSLIAGEPIVLAAIVVERHMRRDSTALVCDLSLENSDGDRAALGVAELQTS